MCQENAKNKTLMFYNDMMMSRIRSRTMIKEDIEAWHKSCFRESQKFLNKSRPAAPAEQKAAYKKQTRP